MSTEGKSELELIREEIAELRRVKEEKAAAAELDALRKELEDLKAESNVVEEVVVEEVVEDIAADNAGEEPAEVQETADEVSTEEAEEEVAEVPVVDVEPDTDDVNPEPADEVSADDLERQLEKERGEKKEEEVVDTTITFDDTNVDVKIDMINEAFPQRY
jgi:hypothetical protein